MERKDILLLKENRKRVHKMRSSKETQITLPQAA